MHKIQYLKKSICVLNEKRKYGGLTQIGHNFRKQGSSKIIVIKNISH